MAVDLQQKKVKADLHTHTNFSDGILSPEELIEKALKKNINILSITDHDNVSAIEVALKAAKKYDIEIINIENQNSPTPKTFRIKVTDPELLKRTGGIVQGMSGTPIIQGNNIIGAISHAVERDPSLGYGVFIGWMINN